MGSSREKGKKTEPLKMAPAAAPALEGGFTVGSPGFRLGQIPDPSNSEEVPKSPKAPLQALEFGIAGGI